MNIEMEIKLEATRQGINLKDIAEALETYPERFSRAITGERPLTTTLAIKAADKLGIPLSELVRRAEENQTKQAA